MYALGVQAGPALSFAANCSNSLSRRDCISEKPKTCRISSRPCIVRASSSATREAGASVGRREALVGGAALVTSALSSNTSALAANAPKGYNAILDNADGYAFFYPFGWQEVAVKGQDVALKDVIEPLESVSVSIIKTDKTSLQELGSPEEVAKALVEKVLSSPTQQVSLVSAKEKTDNDKTYYQFEFVAKAKTFTRHALGTVAIKDGKFYTLTTGANERRWNKMEEKLRTVLDSFTTL